MVKNIIAIQEFSDELKKLWDNLNSGDSYSPFLSFNMHHSWFEIFKKESEVYILNHSDRLLMPLLINNGVAEFTGGMDLFDLHDLIGPKNYRQSILDEILQHCFSVKNINELKIYSVFEDSYFFNKIIKSAKNLSLEIYTTPEDVSPYIELPIKWDDYLSNLSKKNRHEVKRKLKKLENFGSVEVVNSNLKNIDENIELFFSLMSFNKDKKKFLTEERRLFIKKNITDAVQNNFGSLNFLVINGIKVASSFYFENSKKISVYNSGYDPDYRELSVGVLNHILNIKKFLNHKSEVDFLRGDEEYKYRIGCKDRILVSISIKS